MKKPTIGFIGQGFIGKSYADDFERRGFGVTRFALEKKYESNKDKIKNCDIVFIAVPTPTTKRGFDSGIVENALKLVGKGATAVIKSTILPGTTAILQKKFKNIFVMHSPEFLVLKRAAIDAAKPLRNIVGIARNTKNFRERAKLVLSILPPAPFTLICSAEEAELIKYGGNSFLYLKVLFANIICEAATALGADYEVVRRAVAADPRIGDSHLQVLHGSGHRGAKNGRGAGGVCFIKDIAAFTNLYKSITKNDAGSKFWDGAIRKNIDLLISSQKDLDILQGVYGKEILKRTK